MSEQRTVMITGAAGYIGSLLTQTLAEKEYISRIIATDIKELPQHVKSDKIHFYETDVRSPSLGELMRKYHVDVVVHLSTIVTPGKKSNRELEYAVDVLGTKNVLECCINEGVGQLIVTSSGAAYGYYPDSPQWLDENDPLRGNQEFAYSHHKRLVEEMLAEYRQSHPEVKQLIFRPCTILGETTNNQITALFHKPFILGVVGSSIPFSFIWDMDMIACIEKGIRESWKGIFNVAGDGVVTMREIAHYMGKRYISIPPGLLRSVLWLLKKFNTRQYGPEQVNFLRYRPVLSNRRLKQEFGYIPMKISQEVFEYYLSFNK